MTLFCLHPVYSNINNFKRDLEQYKKGATKTTM